MNFCCTACDKQLQLITNTDDDHTRIVCECGVINQVDCTDILTKKLNVSLIKEKIKKILERDLFNTVNTELKEEIISNAYKVKTHAETSLVCFSILYLEYKNKLNFNPQYIIKKKQRKNIIKILVDMESKQIMKFIRTPLTYIDTYSHLYSEEERLLYINISDCLMYLNSCNKKNMEKIYEKIHEILISLRNEEDEKIPKLLNPYNKSKKPKKAIIRGYNIKSLIKFIAITKITIQDLLEFELILFNSKTFL